VATNRSVADGARITDHCFDVKRRARVGGNLMIALEKAGPAAR
jgi:hypothetical protein